MRCWKCGSQIAGSTCLVCGCVQTSRRETATETGAALRYAYDKFGAEQILTDHETLRRCLSDLIPDEKKLRNQISSVMRTNVGQQLYGILRNNQDPDINTYRIIVGNIQASCNITGPDARVVTDYILEMIGCQNPLTFEAPPEPGPEPEYRQTSSVNTGTYQSGPYPPNNSNNEIHVLISAGTVLVEDATAGVGGMKSYGKKGELFVRSDGVYVQFMKGVKKSSKKIAQELFLPRNGIVKVNENFFVGIRAFTVVMADGKRYRMTASAKKEVVVNTIEAIRSIIGNQY